MRRKANGLIVTGVLALALFGAPCTGHLVTGADTSVFAQKNVKKAANEVGDKTEDAADATVKGARVTADKTVDGANVTVKASKKVGHETTDKSKDVAGFFKKMWKKVF